MRREGGLVREGVVRRRREWGKKGFGVCAGRGQEREGGSAEQGDGEAGWGEKGER